jgi:hypothetical protein
MSGPKVTVKTGMLKAMFGVRVVELPPVDG